MNSIVLEPAIKEALLGDCQDFLCSKDWYVSCLATAGLQEFRGFTGTPKGVNSFNTLHVVMLVFMVLYLGRNTLPTWVSAARRAKKVFPHPEIEVIS